ALEVPEEVVPPAGVAAANGVDVQPAAPARRDRSRNGVVLVKIQIVGVDRLPVLGPVCGPEAGEVAAHVPAIEPRRKDVDGPDPEGVHVELVAPPERLDPL